MFELAMMNIGFFELLIVAALGLFFVWPCWRITAKAGLPGALSLIVLLPGGFLILLFVWAFKDWPGQGKA